MNIPGLITLGEAAQRFGVSHDELNGWIAAGVLEIINVDGERLIAEKQAKQVAARLARRNFAHLEGRPIRPAAAARKYKFYYMTLLSWVRKGYIRKLNDEAERAVFLNEADMAYARALADVKGRRKGQPLFSVAGREKQKEIYYLSLQEAARRYRVSPEKLAALVEKGKGRRIQDTILVPEEDAKRLAETQARREAVIRLVKAGYRHLENRPIRLSRAARKYDIPHTTLSLWAKQGHIRVLERGPNCVILDEADVIRAWLLKEVGRLPRSEEVIVRLVRKSYPHLEGFPIRLDDAARKYGIPRDTLSLWARKGYIRVLEGGSHCPILNEADVARARHLTNLLGRKDEANILNRPLYEEDMLETVTPSLIAHLEQYRAARAGTGNIPGMISLEEAVKRFDVSHDELNSWIAAGVLEVINVDGKRLISEEQAERVADKLAKRNFAHLEGKPIRLAAAARKYKLGYMTLSLWVRKGHIRRLNDEAEWAVFLNEADVAYARALADLKGMRWRKGLFTDGKGEGEDVHYLPLAEAVSRYRIAPEKLSQWIGAGKVRVKKLRGVTLVVEKEVKREAVIRQARENYLDLEGRPIRVMDAARKYGILQRTLSRWASRGYIRILDKGPNRLVLNEADVARARDIARQLGMRKRQGVITGPVYATG